MLDAHLNPVLQRGAIHPVRTTDKQHCRFAERSNG
jgi:hypothetical protein